MTSTRQDEERLGDPQRPGDEHRREEPGQSGQPAGQSAEQSQGSSDRSMNAGAVPQPAYEARGETAHKMSPGEQPNEGRPIERKGTGRPGARGTAAMDEKTRKEVARKGGLAVSRNKQHMAEIGRKGGQSVSQNRDHMAAIGRKGGAASRGHRE